MSERKSWEQDDDVGGLDLPEEDFDYDDFVSREFGSAPHRRTGIAWYWYVAAIILLLLLTWQWIFPR